VFQGELLLILQQPSKSKTLVTIYSASGHKGFPDLKDLNAVMKTVLRKGDDGVGEVGIGEPDSFA